MKIYKIRIDVYRVVLEMWVGGTEKEFVEKMKKWGEYIIEDGRQGMYIDIKEKENKNRIAKRIIWIEKRDRYILYHELFHAVCAIMSFKNIHFVETTNALYHHSPEEAYAYLFEFLIREADKIIFNEK